MEQKKVLITRMIPEEGINKLREYFEVEVNELDRAYTYEELKEKVKGKDGVLCLLSDQIDGEIMDVEDRVKIFANYAVGYNNMDVEAAKARDIYLSNTPGVLTDATADIAWALLFATARRVVEGDRYIRDGKFLGWSPKLLLGRDVSGKTIGIIGAGRIGRAVALRAMAFNMKILYYNRSRKENFEKETGAEYVTFKELLEKSDYVSIHTPLTKETTHMISDKEFDMMKDTAILINTSRGPVVDEKALVRALKDKKIWGAGLDVYEKEPEVEEGLKDLSNVVLCPHLGSATDETRIKMAVMAADNIIAVLRDGKVPHNCVSL
ncbi:D-glycerate dehydrogenase [Wukongibacter baidiensis]|uniref:2-hydroxyacid dehydrogenase n=1 Tax=Wukongibacter baidiensis TaxID=1723361 RepID=UPI003D7F314D